MLHLVLLVQLALAPLSFGDTAVEPENVVFVANRTAPRVAVIDTRTDTVLGGVDLPFVPTQIIALGQRRSLIAISSADSALGSVDLYGVRPASEVYLGFEPDFLQVSPDEDLIAVSGTAANVVSIFQVGGPREVHRIQGIQAPGAMVFDKTGERLFVSHRDRAAVTVVDVATGQSIQEIALDETGTAGGVSYLSRTPGGELAFATRQYASVLHIVDLEQATLAASVSLPGPAARSFPTANSQYVLVPNAADRSVSMISTWTLKESVRLPATGGIVGLNTALVDSVALALSQSGNRAVLLDLRDERRLGDFALPGRPETAVTVASGLKVYVALADSDEIGVIDMVEGRLSKTIDGIGREPWAVFSIGGLSYCH
jgi:DNA-binding beta-propeller fold protein YncE